MQWELILVDRVSTFVSMGLALAFAWLVKFAVMNYIGGLRLKSRGFNYGDATIHYKGKRCVIENIGLFSTQLWDIEGQMESVPIANETLIKAEIWRRKPNGKKGSS